MALCESECFGHCGNKRMQEEINSPLADNTSSFVRLFKGEIYDCLVKGTEKQIDCPGFKERILTVPSPATMRCLL